MNRNAPCKAIDPLKGYRILKIPVKLYSILATLIQEHLELPFEMSNTKECTEKLISYFEKNHQIGTRESRTINSSQMERYSGLILEEIKTFLPAPKRLHNNDFYYRIVNPKDINTISIPHRDRYFHEITPGWGFTEKEVSIKMWFPFINLSGFALGLVPGSHLEATLDYAEFFWEDGIKKFRSNHLATQLTPMSVEVGECLLFPDLLIHGSLRPSKLDKIRISGELTLVYDKIKIDAWGNDA